MNVEKYLSQYKKCISETKRLKEELFGLDGLISNAKRKDKKSLIARKKELETEQRNMKDESGNINCNYISELFIVPGNEDRFEQLTGYEVEVVNLDSLDKGVTIIKTRSKMYLNYAEGLEQMLQNKVIGILEVQKSIFSDAGGRWLIYGLPVRRKEMK
jgi:hypothetical protein